MIGITNLGSLFQKGEEKYFNILCSFYFNKYFKIVLTLCTLSKEYLWINTKNYMGIIKILKDLKNL